MQDKKEKTLHLLSILLPIIMFALLAAVIGWILSAAFRVIDFAQTTTEEGEPEDTRRKITVGDVEYPVADDAVVDRIPTVQNYLDGLLDSDFIGADEFMAGVRHVHEEGQNRISLEDLTPYEYRSFMDSVFMKDYGPESNLSMIHKDYPMEIIIPINEYDALTVYKLLDGDAVVYVYIECVTSREQDTWYWNPGFYPVTERIAYENVESLQVGDSLYAVTELCPAVNYQIRDSHVSHPYYIILEEGMLIVYIDQESCLDTPNKSDPTYEIQLSDWMKRAKISKLDFVPFGNILTEGEKTELVFYHYWISEIPYILLPE